MNTDRHSCHFANEDPATCDTLFLEIDEFNVCFREVEFLRSCLGGKMRCVQVKVQVVLKGRSRMFEKQARSGFAQLQLTHA